MKVSELIAELLKYDQEAEVFLCGYSSSDGGTGEVVDFDYSQLKHMLLRCNMMVK